jgi:hypothetical protein
VIRRLGRASAILVRDDRIPKPLRGVAILGLLPVPGPFDEAVLIVVGILLFAWRREALRDAWCAAAPATP